MILLLCWSSAGIKSPHARSPVSLNRRYFVVSIRPGLHTAIEAAARVQNRHTHGAEAEAGTQV